MNIKITKSEHNRLLKHQVHEYIIGSHLYKTNDNNSDKDLVCIYDDFLLKNAALHLNAFPNIHSFQYDDMDNNVQYIWMSSAQFWQNQRSGEVTINSDIVMFYPAFKNALALCQTYKVIRAYLGYAKRDLKQIKNKTNLIKSNPIILFLLLLILSFMLSCKPKPMPNTYQVVRTKHPVQIDGKGSDKAWKKAHELTAFTYPWRTETAPPTSFKALWDDKHFYFLFRATDADIFLKKSGLEEKDAVESDRVEIFFKADDAMNPYYSLEMDALGRVFDSKGQFYRKIDMDWNWPEGHLVVKATMDKEGYGVEGAISLKSLRYLGMYKNDGILKAGLYRGEYVSKADGTTKPKWISWIHPISERPDFHIPSSFGVLQLMSFKSKKTTP